MVADCPEWHGDPRSLGKRVSKKVLRSVDMGSNPIRVAATNTRDGSRSPAQACIAWKPDRAHDRLAGDIGRQDGPCWRSDNRQRSTDTKDAGTLQTSCTH